MIIFVAAVLIPWFWQRLSDPGCDDSVPDLLARSDRAQSADRLYRPSFAWHRRFHGGRRVRLLQAHHLLPGREYPHLDCRRGIFSAAVGVLFGLPSCASRASTWRWRRSRRSSSCRGASSACPGSTITTHRVRSRYRRGCSLGIPVTGATATDVTRYLVVLAIVIAMTWIASNIVHGRIGRMWMAVRDMDLAAELIGIRLLRPSFSLLRYPRFYCGVAGALLVFLWYGGAEPAVFDVNLSFFILFMVIVGGLGSLTGSYLRRGTDLYPPIVLRYIPPEARHPDPFGHRLSLQYMIVGALIISFLIVEPNGLARLWQIPNRSRGCGLSRTERSIRSANPGEGTAAICRREHRAAQPHDREETDMRLRRVLSQTPLVAAIVLGRTLNGRCNVMASMCRCFRIALGRSPPPGIAINNGMADYLNMLNEPRRRHRGCEGHRRGM